MRIRTFVLLLAMAGSAWAQQNPAPKQQPQLPPDSKAPAASQTKGAEPKSAPAATPPQPDRAAAY